jgi:hypothetical protein
MKIFRILILLVILFKAKLAGGAVEATTIEGEGVDTG